MGKRELKLQLATFDKEQLIGLIGELYEKEKSVRAFLDYYLNPKEDKALATCRERVREAFYPKRGFQLKLASGKKAISDFRKLKPSPESMVDLLLTYVETGVEYTLEFGDIDEAFYMSLESVFRDAMKIIKKNKLQKEFEARAELIVTRTEHTGWGFYEALAEAQYRTYGN